jgi:hypothetical protein
MRKLMIRPRQDQDKTRPQKTKTRQGKTMV